MHIFGTEWYNAELIHLRAVQSEMIRHFLVILKAVAISKPLENGVRREAFHCSHVVGLLDGGLEDLCVVS